MNNAVFVSLTILCLLSVSSITGLIQVAKAESGTVTINADGSITPSTAPIYSADNVTYTLTGNITSSHADGIDVERDNIVLDGAGFTVQGEGTGNDGIGLSNTSNVTIENTNIEGWSVGTYLENSSNNTISANNMTANNGAGIEFSFSSDNTIYGNNVTSNSNGVGLDSSSNNTISENTITANYLGASTMESDPVWGVGLMLADSSNNTVSKNDIQNNTIGVELGASSDNTLSENIIAGNLVGINLEPQESLAGASPMYSSNNVIYHNSFINNGQQAIGGLQNVWDNGYPSGGNYWSDYNGTDMKSGPYQNVTGSDGVGDTPYVIDANNTDEYPLMGTYYEFFPSFFSSGNVSVIVISNFTISDLIYSIWLSTPYDGLQGGYQFIEFLTSGQNGSVGFCRVMIPRTILNVSSYAVWADNNSVNVTELPISNSTYVYLYFTYTQPTNQIIVTIPEFPSPLILPLFMATTLLAIAIYKKKHNRS